MARLVDSLVSSVGKMDRRMESSVDQDPVEDNSGDLDFRDDCSRCGVGGADILGFLFRFFVCGKEGQCEMTGKGQHGWGTFP